MRAVLSAEARSDSFGVLVKASLRTGGLTCITTIQVPRQSGQAYFTFARRVGDGYLKQRSWWMRVPFKRGASATLRKNDGE